MLQHMITVNKETTKKLIAIKIRSQIKDRDNERVKVVTSDTKADT